MTWYLAPSLATLRSEVDAYAPNRSKASDGTIGNDSHEARKSDHNPDAGGSVNALDLTHDPSGGLDAHALADRLIARCRSGSEKRVSHVISRGRIASGTYRASYWTWRRYDGANPHLKHIHISVHHTADGENSTRTWALTLTIQPEKEPDVELSDRVKLTNPETGKRTWAGNLIKADSISVNGALGLAAAALYQMRDLTDDEGALKAELAKVRADIAAVQAKLDQVAAGNIDYDTLAAKVADLLHQRLAS